MPPFTESLRLDTCRMAAEILALLQQGFTPPLEFGAKCAECSLKELCLPELPDSSGLHAYLEGMS